MTDIDAKNLKEEIDVINKNDKIEIEEMKKFLESKDNLIKLGKALEGNMDSDLLNEFQTVMSELCKKMPKIEKCTLNQYKILLFYIDKFEPKDPKDKSAKIYKNVKEKVDNAAKDYLKKVNKGKDVRGPIQELVQENKLELLKKVEETIKKKTEELIVNGELDPNKIMWEMMNKFFGEKEKKEWEANKQKIQGILDKDGELTKEDKDDLLRFRNGYYSLYHENYNNLGIDRIINLKMSEFRPYEEYDNIAAKIDKKLNSGLFNYVDDIISKGLPQKINIKGLSDINQWIKEFGDTTIENQANKEKLKEIISKEAQKITNKNLKNVDLNKLNQYQIGIFQLRANTEHGENLRINGAKSNLSNKGEVSEGEITSLYIYRQRLKVRESKSIILQIPDIDDLLGQIDSKDAHKIMREFLNYFFKIKNTAKDGGGESKIGGAALKNLLEFMVCTKIYEGKDIKNEIENRGIIKETAEKGSEIYAESEEKLKMLQELEKEMKKEGKETNISTYYNKIYGKQKKAIDDQNNKNIEAHKEYLAQLAEQKKIEGINNKLNDIISRINKLDSSSPEKYKKGYKGIATDFIKIWENNKSYLKDNPLCPQIFIEIYCLRKNDGIAGVFGKDVENQCNKYKEQLGLISDSEHKKYEKIADIYYQVDALNEMIKNGVIWEEKHYDKHDTKIIMVNTCPTDGVTQTMRVSNAYRNPQIRNQVESTTRATTIEHKDLIIHVDLYKGPGYNENHETIVQIKYRDGTVKKFYGYGTKNYNPYARLVPPDPNGWYAILPKNLKKKSNEGKIKLGIIDGVACVYEFESGKDIKIWKFNKRTRTLEKTPKVITVAEYNKALTIQNLELKLWDNEHGAEYQAIQEELKIITDKNNDLQSLLKERKKEDLDKKELKDLQTGAIKLYNLTRDFSNNRGKLLNIKKDLQKLNRDTPGSYENPHEKQIKDMIETIDKILEFATKDQVNKAREFRDYCLNHVERNDTWWSRRKSRLPGVLAFIAAIAVTVASWGSLSWVGVALVSAAVSIEVHEATQIALNQFTGYGSVTVDGVTYNTHYTNPTLIEQALDPNSDVTLRDCVKGYGTQFVTSALLQMCLMKGGARASKYIGARISKAPAGSFTKKGCDLLCTLLCKEGVGTDAYTQGLINSVERQVTKQGFMKSFSKEFVEEAFEEGVENAAESVSPALGVVAMIIHSIKPKPGMALMKAKVGSPELSIPNGQRNVIAKTTYDGSNKNNITTLENYYNSLNGDAEATNNGEKKYEVKREGDILKVTVKGAFTGEGKSGEIITKDMEVEFHPSNASLEARSLSGDLLSFGAVHVDHKTGRVYYNSETKLKALGLYCKEKGIGEIEIKEDGTAILKMGKKKIELVKNGEGNNISNVDNTLGNRDATKDNNGDVTKNISNDVVIELNDITLDSNINEDEIIYEAEIINENEYENNGNDIYNKNEMRRVANIFNEFVDFDVDEYVERHLDIALSGKNEQYIRDVLSFIKSNIINNISIDNTISEESYYFYNAKVVDYILSNSKLTLENMKNVLQDKRISIKDIEYVVKQNNNISEENELIQEIKKFNILLHIENEGDLQKYITGKKHGSDITGNINQSIEENGLSEKADKIENRYNGNYNPETQKFTMARDIGNSDFDMQLIQNIINKQNIKPRGLENNSVYDLLNELHNSERYHDEFILYSKYLLGEDVTSEAGEYSLGSGGGVKSDPALYRHTRIGDEGVFEGRKYRIIGEFSPGEIVRSGTIEQVNHEANWGESERITLGEISSNNVSQIIDLETGNVVYDRDSGYVDFSLNNTGTENNPETIYFNGKSTKFGIEESLARGISMEMDEILNEINEQNESEILEDLRIGICEQYKNATGKELYLTDEQILSILDAHDQDGILGQLTTRQLTKKVRILSETIPDKDVRRFLLEAGFCGSMFSKFKEGLGFNDGGTAKLKQYEIGQQIFIPGSYGRMTTAQIVAIDPNTENYILVRKDGLNQYTMRVNRSFLDIHNTRDCSLGEEVKIRNNNSRKTAKVIEYSSKTGYYKVSRTEGNAKFESYATKRTLLNRKNNPNAIPTTDGQYHVGQQVNIPRSDGRITKANIIEYNPKTGYFQMKRDEGGIPYTKIINKSSFDGYNPRDFFVGENVNILDNNSWKTAKVIEYNPKTGYYKVSRTESSGVQRTSYATKRTLNKSINPNTIPTTDGQYRVGQQVNIPRTDGRVTEANITEYNPETGYFKMERKESGSRLYKFFKGGEIDPYNYRNVSNGIIDNGRIDNNAGVRVVNNGRIDNNAGVRVVNDGRIDNDVDVIIEPDGLHKLDYNEKASFKNLPKTNIAKSYLDRNFEPQNKIDLGNGKYLYVTDKISNSDGRPIIIGYAIENGVINLRFFYRSDSEGCWRSCPGVIKYKDKNGKIKTIYSKAQDITNAQYETTTKVDPRIGETFDNLSETSYKNGCPIIESGMIGNEILLEEMKKSISVDKKLFPTLDNSAVNFYMGREPFDVVAGYNRLVPQGLDFQNMKLNPGKSYTYKHDSLGTVNVQVCTIKWNGIDLDFHFARATNSPDKVRIENVVYSDAKINSFGVYDKQVNAGPLVAKPIDYAIPGNDNGRQVPKNRNGTRYGKYMDIRDLYQGNPIIQWYKNNIK